MNKLFAPLFLCVFAMLVPAVAFAAPLAVTVSIPPQKYFVEKIGRGDVAVTVMTGKGRDPHSYEPTAAQMRGISSAEVYIAIGVPFESQWLPKFRALNPTMRVVSLLDGVPRLKGGPDLALRGVKREEAGTGEHGHHDHEGEDNHEHGHGDSHGHSHGPESDDPHIWLSPKVMARAIPAIAAALGEARPEMAAVFNARAEVLIKETRGLDAYINALFAPIPPEKRLFLTFHQSWAYYADNFGLREVSVELGGREAGPKSMALLMDFAAQNKVQVIVADAMTPKAAVSAIAKGINGTAVTASTLDENWPQSLRKFSEQLARALAGTR